MGWEDRQYYRDRGGDLGNPLRFLLNGSIPLFTAFGIRVRAHMTLILFIALTVFFGGLGYKGFGWQNRVEAMSILFAIILLHEYGHCFAARWVGGDPDQIMLTPLGGLAYANAPHRPLATFITVAGGPAVNVVICLAMALSLYALTHSFHWNPYKAYSILVGPRGFERLPSYLYWIYAISLALLLFNLLPIFPLDGGQMLQAAMWPKLGYGRSMNIACIVGIIGGVIFAVIGLFNEFLLTCIAVCGILTCINMRRQLKEAGPEFEYGANQVDYSVILRPDKPAKRRRRVNRWAIRRLRREAEREVAEQQRIDAILSKVSAHGMHSLNWSERRALRKATERQRKREIEFSRQR